ncbi:beta-N-acetylhexosaminidase [uncultured Paraglaciecola sp.]|uniref:beta-N-acetylhexosaminidase n=1 Tax=uncultured Paraglaciecola sp. TaxID=1765024 RepID=UPI00263158A2|nr:beta-N-acetylhexosaminidase [uncultured Paraglaciecola sp.]
MSVSCAVKTPEDPATNAIIAQKLMLDLRYFCADNQVQKPCRTPVTTLPQSLINMIADTGIGGVILFAENLQDTAQILTLNQSIQRAAIKGGHGPVFIAIDQEGGRVVRLPQNLGTSFAGNMAIGATFAQHGDKYARITGNIMAKELLSLGFNLNFAPTVDVNVNPQNPVINVRSFGEDPNIVAQLGTAQLVAMQAQGMIATLKHFPGHGDTSVDSHTGLPRVEHDLAQIERVDLKPFQHVIDNADPGMIMTAHIQYPQLDNSKFTAKDGSKVILPATMSRQILTNILRGKMGFKGIIVSDALNMAGIAHYYKQTEAVIQTFSAGTDIALMPLSIRRPSDIPKLKQLISNVANAVQTGQLNAIEMQASAQRIANLKSTYRLSQQLAVPIEKSVANAQTVLGALEHKQLEQQLANHSIVKIKNNGVFPINESVRNVLLVMPDTTKCMGLHLALKRQLSRLNIQCQGLASHSDRLELQALQGVDLIIAADITPDQSLAELGGMDDIQGSSERSTKQQQNIQLLNLLSTAKDLGKHTVFISLRTPYNSHVVAPFSDAILASFSYRLTRWEYMDDYGRLITQYQGPIFKALAQVLSGDIQPTGHLPVTIH